MFRRVVIPDMIKDACTERLPIDLFSSGGLAKS